MIKVLYSEILKLKGSWIFIISILGSLVSPVLTVLSYFTLGRKDNIPFMIDKILEQNHFFVTLLIGMLLYSLITVYVISREYQEHTLPALLTIPVSRITLLTAKIAVIFLWVLVLTVFSYVSCLVIAFPFGAEGYEVKLLLKLAVSYLLSALLLMPILIFVAALTIVTKNYIIPLGAVIAKLLVGIVLLGHKSATLFPATIPLLLSSTRKMSRADELVPYAVLIVICYGAVSLVSAFVIFYKADVT